MSIYTYQNIYEYGLYEFEYVLYTQIYIYTHENIHRDRTLAKILSVEIVFEKKYKA